MARMRRRAGACLAAAVIAAAALVLVSAPAHATTFLVTSTADSGANTLRAAFVAASADVTGPHTIDIQVSAPIVLTGGALSYGNVANEPLTINGNGATVQQTTLGSRVISNITSTGLLTVNGLTITGGNNPSGGGGAIKWAGPVTIVNSVITGNNAPTGGGISSDGAVTVTRSVISGNTATSAGGGGIEALGLTGSVTVVDSTISGNTAGAGGGGITSPGAVAITRSTISGNTAATGAGGVSSLSTITVTNSTITGNTATAGAGGGLTATGTTTLVYATVVGNTASSGSNIALGGTGTLASFGSVVALPLGSGTNCVSLLATSSSGWNFSDDSSCNFSMTAIGDRQSAGDPKLGSLAANGGPTQTRRPLPGSPLIDAIPAASCQTDGAAGITTDQIGNPRPSGTGCDIGAVEVQVVVVTARFTG